jgi:hypothetical protein
VLELGDEVVALCEKQCQITCWQAGLITANGSSYLVHDCCLLLQCHGNWVLVAVAVQSDLMAGVGDHTAFFWERLERMTGNEPSGLDVVALEHLQETADTDCSGEETLRNCQSTLDDRDSPCRD